MSQQPYWSPPGGYTCLAVGMTSVPGAITQIYPNQFGGKVGAAGNGNFQQYGVGGLETGSFAFYGKDIPGWPPIPFAVGDAVTFDIVQGEHAVYATNIQKV